MTENIQIGNVITVKSLAEKLEVPITSIISMLLKNGIVSTINENIDYETASIIASEFEKTTELSKTITDHTVKTTTKNVKIRPPVVTVMGHVDHGKTTLLDKIRKVNTVKLESGGITQHIAAYQVNLKDSNKKDRQITFLDTPGHAAFSAMRQHGVTVTDLVVLVVAADDGVKPQTIEVIDYCKQESVPIIIALNKMDQQAANPDRVKQQLAELELVPEEWGGSTVIIPVSAVTGLGINDLLEMILLVYDIKPAKVDFDGNATGVVIESKMKIGKGPLATVLMQNGILKAGDIISVGKTYGKIRSLEDYNGEKLENASPGQPVTISGFNQLPDFGDVMTVVDNEKDAKSQSETFASNIIHGKVHSINKTSLEDMVNEESTISHKLSIILKADVKGSVEAVKKVIEEIGNADATIEITKFDVGPVNESDITLASATKSAVLAFRVPISTQIRSLADKTKVKITSYDVIYDLVEDAKKALTQILPEEKVEKEIGIATVLALFSQNNKQRVIGIKIDEGKVIKGADFHIVRAKETISDSKVVGIRRGKEDVNEMINGQEAGLLLPGDSDIEVKDKLHFYQTEFIKKTLE
jgi:translation initiation factor IF-2